MFGNLMLNHNNRVHIDQHRFIHDQDEEEDVDDEGPWVSADINDVLS